MDTFSLPGIFAGWACVPEPAGALDIVAMLDGREIGRTRADQPRADLDPYGYGHSGFLLTTTEMVAAAMPAEGRLCIVAMLEDGRRSLLPFGPQARARSDVEDLAEQLVAALGAVADRDLAPALDGLALSASVRPHLPALRHLVRSIRIGTAEPQAGNGLAPLLLPVGTEAADGSAVLGRDGFVFLTRGSNDVLGLMDAEPDDPRLLVLAADWVALIVDRQARLAGAGITYLQMIIPEKICVLPECFPGKVTTPSAVLALIELAIAHDPALSRSYVPALDLLRARPEESFRRVDSHLTPMAAFRLVSAMVEQRGAVPPPMPVFDRPVSMSGDLGRRFFGVHLYDVMQVASPDLPAPVKLHRIDPPDGGHVGLREAWRNSQARYPGRVLIFGNSFFAPSGQEGMLWWITRLFEEVHFHWNAALDDEQIKAVQPDLVIGQTVERFLPMVPER